MWNPRTCGEKSLTCERIDFRLGSPPRRRGKVQLVECILARAGITPAWAGKRAFQSPPRTVPQDHPRMGGEKLRFPAFSARELGSPPRGQGKDGLDLIAYEFAQDHPRVGGEKFPLPHKVIPPEGSPPRGRGKGSLIALSVSVARITPAWAGKSAGNGFFNNEYNNHPRVGGEKRWISNMLSSSAGSPPRGRGKASS